MGSAATMTPTKTRCSSIKNRTTWPRASTRPPSRPTRPATGWRPSWSISRRCRAADGRPFHGLVWRCRRFVAQPCFGTTSSGVAALTWPCSTEAVRCSSVPNGLPINGFERLQIFSAGSVSGTSICKPEMTSSESDSSINRMKLNHWYLRCVIKQINFDIFISPWLAYSKFPGLSFDSFLTWLTYI